MHRVEQAKDERGATLVELLVAMAAGLVVFGAAALLLVVALNQSSRQTERIAALDSERVAFDRMTRELRQASWAVLDGQTVAAAIPSGSGERQVSWSCDSGQCVHADGATGSSQVMLDGLVNEEPFAEGAGAVLEINFVLRPDPAFSPVEVSGAVSFRNCTNVEPPVPGVILNPCPV